MNANYYEILGIDRSASPEAIKQAYRKLAREYHPDNNKALESEERFKSISEAYEILIDPENRRLYDVSFSSSAIDFSTQINSEYQAQSFSNNWTSFPESASTRTTNNQSHHRGSDIEFVLKINLLQAALGDETTIEIKRSSHCCHCQGTGKSSNSVSSICLTCSGSGQVADRGRNCLKPCPDCCKEKTLVCSDCRGSGSVTLTELLQLSIPAGVDTGTQLRVSGKGNEGKHGGSPGDLYVKIAVQEHPDFKRVGNNLLSKIRVSYLEALLGVTIETKTLYGLVTLSIPACTQPDTRLLLPGKGLPLHGKPDQIGDQVVEVNVYFPLSLSPQESLLLESIAALQRN
jgi:molecular chaperone DnaJ